ncbi:SDR family oxidoreductase, partial [Streptomyces sp. UNOC14_S4]|uniref:SDR family oxidoreductase n=1 Tax=Streptomyces sp. UNOC14_S4 TaxID=2872340 RepID=UPI001E35A049
MPFGSTGICAGRVAVVTGAGRGLGRAHALALAAEGARVVVNDLGVGRDGAGRSAGPARQVADEITARGGEAVAHDGDIATEEGAASLVATALERYGRLDALVSNAGFLRDRMLVNLGEDDWDAVIRVHLKGHFLPLRHAAAHWRAETKAGRRPEAARVVHTTSGAGLLGSVGQANYAAAKAGIVGLTLVAAAELGRYGVQVNAIAPAARTRMTEGVFPEAMAPPAAPGGFDAMAPENVSPVVVWLASAASAG